MIKFQFKNREFLFSGFNTEASYDDGIVYINGDANDIQFAIELFGNTPKEFTKNDQSSSIYLAFPDGSEYSAYFEDGIDESSLKITISRFDNVVEGTFEAILSGENSNEKITNGSFSVNIDT